MAVTEVKKSSRIVALDLMRGYFLIAILLDHLMFFPNGLDWLSGQGKLFVSAAEGFFFISGLVLGIVRGRKLVQKPFSFVAKLLIKRGWQLYLTAVVLFFIFTFIGWLFIDNPGLKPGIRPIDQSFLEIVWGALTFEYIYGWADYLRLYAIYMFISPIAMWLLRQNKWYIVLTLSLLSWLYFPYSPLSTGELSQVFSWQLIFFGGMTLGYHLTTVRDWWRGRTEQFRHIVTATIVSVAAITMILNFTITVLGTALFGEQTTTSILSVISPYFEKNRLPLIRIGLFLIWFTGGYWLFRRYEQPIRRWLGWLLELFGTHSLYVYTIEAFVIFFIHLLIAPGSATSIPVNFCLSIISIALVWLATRYKFLAKIIPR